VPLERLEQYLGSLSLDDSGGLLARSRWPRLESMVAQARAELGA